MKVRKILQRKIKFLRYRRDFSNVSYPIVRPLSQTLTMFYDTLITVRKG